jgi:hypothetical protein
VEAPQMPANTILTRTTPLETIRRIQGLSLNSPRRISRLPTRWRTQGREWLRHNPETR